MNLTSCSKCCIVVNLKRMEFLDPYPHEGEDMDNYYGETDENMIWGGDGYLDTWKCPVCETYNGVEKCEN